LEKPKSVETRNKKQKENRKFNRKKWKGNLLILEMRAWKTSPPTGKGEGGETIALPTPKNILGNCLFAQSGAIQE